MTSAQHNPPPTSADGFPVLDPRVAGIDVGSEQHWVCAPTTTGLDREVAVFDATTPGLQQLAAWLHARHVRSVALESTGVYWIPVHEVLEAQGFDLVLVDTRTLGRVPGRTKSDRRDCEWIQRLHSCGLLRGAFRPGRRSVCCGPWCATARRWWPNAPTGCGGCRRAWIR